MVLGESPSLSGPQFTCLYSEGNDAHPVFVKSSEIYILKNAKCYGGISKNSIVKAGLIIALKAEI